MHHIHLLIGALVLVLFILFVIWGKRQDKVVEAHDEEVKAILGQTCVASEKLPQSWVFAKQLPSQFWPMSVLVGQYKAHSAIVVRALISHGNNGAHEQTYVAVERSDAAPFRPAAFTSTFEFLEQGRWILGTVDRQVLDVDGIRGILDCLT